MCNDTQRSLGMADGPKKYLINLRETGVEACPINHLHTVKLDLLCVIHFLIKAEIRSFALEMFWFPFIQVSTRKRMT
jgi:hypothetical protein